MSLIAAGALAFIPFAASDLCRNDFGAGSSFAYALVYFWPLTILAASLVVGAVWQLLAGVVVQLGPDDLHTTSVPSFRETRVASLSIETIEPTAHVARWFEYDDGDRPDSASRYDLLIRHTDGARTVIPLGRAFAKVSSVAELLRRSVDELRTPLHYRDSPGTRPQKSS
jgi:hypothetical protein